MKKLLSLIGLVVGLSLGTQAQNVQYILNNGVVPIGASNVVTFTSHVGNEIGVQINVGLTGAGTSGIALVFEQSNNNSTWSTTPIQFWRAANGATSVSHYTNFTINAAPFMRVTVHNTNSVAVTNSTITINNKRAY